MFKDVDLSLKLNEKEYEKELGALQLKLVGLEQRLRTSPLSVLITYEGWDASGKGGSILRITEKLDPRGFQVLPIAAPTEIEKQYHYLWRFWTRLPPTGKIAIFDRSWYGRVLVERVEKFAHPAEWKRAYREIRDFERTLTDNGMVIIKFWLHISKDEQLKRFKEREHDPFKEWKIGPEDWRNREKWDDYMVAAEEMFAETNTPETPWHLISAECKRYARIETLKTVVHRVEKALKG